MIILVLIDRVSLHKRPDHTAHWGLKLVNVSMSSEAYITLCKDTEYEGAVAGYVLM